MKVLLQDATVQHLRATTWNRLNKWGATVERQWVYRWTNELEFWFCMYLCNLGHAILVIPSSVRLGKSYLFYLPCINIERLKWASEYEHAIKSYCNGITPLWTLVWVCNWRLMVSYFCWCHFLSSPSRNFDCLSLAQRTFPWQAISQSFV